ncbi:ester cyclase [Pseudonocardia benzenivorans]
MLGVAGSGAAIDVEGLTVLRFVGDRCVERWNRLDDLTLLSQIGALPAPAGA